ncbi:MAG: hypothetical protein JSC189_000954 [Candidatus Tokpelaia sp. JSC189]|nr:MAG: hypothetical protein JSC189_000954 [Candidatus Tokpelaia sp. JSC189]
MMPNIVAEKQSYKANKGPRRWFVILATIALLMIIYSAFWYVMAGLMQGRVSARLRSSEQYGIIAHCENLHKTGYPFQIGMACDKLTWSGLLAGFSFASNLFVASAPVYAPHWISLHVTVPVTLKLSGLKLLQGQWKGMQFDTNLDNCRLRNIVFTIDQLVFKDVTAANFEKPIAADLIRLDADSRDDKFNIRLSFDKLMLPVVVSDSGREFPRMDGAVELMLDDVDHLSMLPGSLLINWRKRYFGTLSKAVLSMESGGQLTISGPFSVSAEGVLSGQFTVAFSNSGAIMRTIRNFFPEQARTLEIAFFALNNMSKNVKDDPQIIFNIENGKARVGFIKLGDIPF